MKLSKFGFSFSEIEVLFLNYRMISSNSFTCTEIVIGVDEYCYVISTCLEYLDSNFLRGACDGDPDFGTFWSVNTKFLPHKFIEYKHKSYWGESVNTSQMSGLDTFDGYIDISISRNDDFKYLIELINGEKNIKLYVYFSSNFTISIEDNIL